MVTYSENKKYAFFDGLRFCRDEKTGYYLNSTIRKRLHRYVFEKMHGEIPKGYHVHHADHNKENNEPDNLMLLTGSQHEKLHGLEMTEEERAWCRNNIIENAVPAAKEWHNTSEGSEWHKKHYESMKDALHARETKQCKQCGKTFNGTIKKTNVFCSNACRAAWRRKTGVDDEERICLVCGRPFKVNRYSKTKCCSGGCANRLRHANRSHQETATAAGVQHGG